MSDFYFGAFCVFVLYLIVRSIIKSIIKKVRRQHSRKRNRDAQFSGWATDTCEYANSSEVIGKYGEKKVAFLLRDLEHDNYQVFNDLLIKKGNYTTQIDHIIISRYGVFVLETKNVHGKVYGSGTSEYWKQYLPDTGYRRYGITQKHQLRNPLWQNAGHINSLRRHVFGYHVPIYGIVAFSDDTDLFVTAEQPVMKMSGIVPYIRTFQDEVLSSDKMDFYIQRLSEVISTSEADRKEHIVNVQQNQERWDTAVANGKCPRCGGDLVLRDGKYGQFYGCSHYPKCKYILKNNVKNLEVEIDD